MSTPEHSNDSDVANSMQDFIRRMSAGSDSGASAASSKPVAPAVQIVSQQLHESKRFEPPPRPLPSPEGVPVKFLCWVDGKIGSVYLYCVMPPSPDS